MNSYQGITKDELEKDILKLDYQNNEIFKELKEALGIIKQLGIKYTSPIDQSEINNSIRYNIDMLRTNRDNDINLLRDKIKQYNNTTEETEKIISKVETNIVIE